MDPASIHKTASQVGGTALRRASDRTRSSVVAARWDRRDQGWLQVPTQAHGRQTPEAAVDGKSPETHTSFGPHTSPAHAPPAGTGCWQMLDVLHTSPALHGTPSQALLQYPPSPLGGRVNENEQLSARHPSSAAAFIDVTCVPSVSGETSEVSKPYRSQGLGCASSYATTSGTKLWLKPGRCEPP